MPNGFVGGSAKQYLTAINDALNAAISTHMSNAHDAPVRNVEPPFTPGDALTGWGGGAISADVQDYNQAMRITSAGFDGAGYLLHSQLSQVEKMCGNEFKLPMTTEAVLNITEQLKNALNTGQRLIEQYTSPVNALANNLIGNGAVGNTIDMTWSPSAANSVRGECERALDKQANQMNETLDHHNRTIRQLEEEMHRQNNIAQTAMRTVMVRVTFMTANGPGFTMRPQSVPDEAARAAARAEAAQIQQRINELRQAKANITSGISTLRGAIVKTGRLFESLEDEIRGTDRQFANMIERSVDDMHYFRIYVRDIIDSIKTNFGGAEYLTNWQMRMRRYNLQKINPDIKLVYAIRVRNLEVRYAV